MFFLSPGEINTNLKLKGGSLMSRETLVLRHMFVAVGEYVGGQGEY